MNEREKESERYYMIQCCCCPRSSVRGGYDVCSVIKGEIEREREK